LKKPSVSNTLSLESYLFAVLAGTEADFLRHEIEGGMSRSRIWFTRYSAAQQALNSAALSAGALFDVMLDHNIPDEAGRFVFEAHRKMSILQLLSDGKERTMTEQAVKMINLAIDNYREQTKDAHEDVQVPAQALIEALQVIRKVLVRMIKDLDKKPAWALEVPDEFPILKEMRELCEDIKVEVREYIEEDQDDKKEEMPVFLGVPSKPPARMLN
jgi:hypothetical protein